MTQDYIINIKLKIWENLKYTDSQNLKVQYFILTNRQTEVAI